MSFKRFALFFKQDYVGGYRYLDRCGEFLLIAQQKMNLIPTGDTTPSGGTMECPEKGIKVECNTSLLRVTHELPGTDLATFPEYAKFLSSLYQELFQPLSVDRMGIAVTDYIPFNDAAKAEAVSLSWGDKYHESLARVAGMSPASKTTELLFAAGSKNLRTKIHPATFEQVRTSTRNTNARLTPQQRSIAARQNAGSQRALQFELAHALLVNFDLTEDTPPINSFDALFSELLEKEQLMLPEIFKQKI